MDRVINKVRSRVKSIMMTIAKGLNSASNGKLTPNMVTFFGFFMHIPIALLIASGDFLAAGILLIIFGLFDALDGALARVQNRTSNTGMFYDSVTDRAKEIMLYTAIAYYFVSVYTSLFAIWVVAACGVALLVSYINAWGEVVTADLPKEKNHTKNKAFRGGLMSFDVRIIFIIIGLFTNQLPVAIIAIACLSLLTALQRSWVIVRGLQ